MYDILLRHIQKNYEILPLVKIGNKGGSCRFCKSSKASYRNKSHSIPELLGNKSIFTLDECDECNKYFGRKIERDLSEFVTPSWFTKLKGKNGRRTMQALGGIKLSSDVSSLNIEFPDHSSNYLKDIILETKGRSFAGVNVYKAWVKILVSILPEKYLSDFDDTTKWLLSDDGFEKLNHRPFILVGNQLPDFRLPDVMDVELVRQQNAGEDAVYQLDVRFNNYYIKLPFSPKAKCMFRVGEVIPARNEIEKVYFQEIDLSKYVSKHNYKLKLDISSVK